MRPGSAAELALSRAACGLPNDLDRSALADRTFMIMLQDFMEPWTFTQKNAMKYYKEILLPDGKQIPFYTYNSVGYREQARGPRPRPPPRRPRRHALRSPAADVPLRRRRRGVTMPP